ncbi:MAG: hypothetical protein ACOYM2_20725 [Rectinemataceae bacterium]
MSDYDAQGGVRPCGFVTIAMRGWLLDPERWYLLKLAIKALLPACCVPFFQKKQMTE